jgi:2',3'-cyclic-nucleotide 2'-phosphodiesterase (5'-nucleotidase family)
MLKFFIPVLSVFILSGCKVKKISNYSGNNISVTDTAFKANDLDKMIAPYKVEMESKMNKVIGHSNQSLTNYSPESPLGNFVADVVFESALNFSETNEAVSLEELNTICLLNFGGLRAPINEGDISIRNIYELMPFDNEVVIVSLSPNQVKEMLNYLFMKNGQPISNGQIVLSADSKKLVIGGEAYDFEKNINIITSDYLAKGGDKMSFLKSGKMIQTGILMRDALLNYVVDKNELPEFKVENRVSFVK